MISAQKHAARVALKDGAKVRRRLRLQRCVLRRRRAAAVLRRRHRDTAPLRWRAAALSRHWFLQRARIAALRCVVRSALCQRKDCANLKADML